MYIVIEDHIKEIKYRVAYVTLCLFVYFALFYTYSTDILFLLSKPLNRGLIFTSLAESFFNQIELSIACSFIFTLPFLIYQSWAFIKPGLYKFEETFFRHTMYISFFLYFISILISYFFILPTAIQFLLGYQNLDSGVFQIEFYPKISNFLSFIYKVITASLFLFQIPTITLVLYRFNCITSQFMITYRRYFFITIFILAAIFSPPDIASQLILAIPLIVAYEIIIVYLIFLDLASIDK